ncbi:MAG: hypothetical protein WC389_20765, partial [Lutibacter sp.]
MLKIDILKDIQKLNGEYLKLKTSTGEWSDSSKKSEKNISDVQRALAILSSSIRESDQSGEKYIKSTKNLNFAFNTLVKNGIKPTIAAYNDMGVNYTEVTDIERIYRDGLVKEQQLVNGQSTAQKNLSNTIANLNSLYQQGVITEKELLALTPALRNEIISYKNTLVTVTTEQNNVNNSADALKAKLKLLAENQVKNNEYLRAAASARWAEENKIANDSLSLALDTAKEAYNVWKEKPNFSNWISGFSATISAMKSIFDGIISPIGDQIANLGSSINGLIQGIIDNNNAALEQSLSVIQENMDAELEAAGLAEETEAERAQNKIDALRENLNTETDIKNKKQIEQQLQQAINDKKTADIKEKYEKQKQESEKKTAIKNYELQKAAFYTNMGFQIANVWISAAAGVVGAMAMSISQLGPIAGSIVGAILST